MVEGKEGVTIPWALVTGLVSIVSAALVGLLLRLAHKGVIAGLQKDCADVANDLKLLKQTVEYHRRDAESVEGRVTTFEREWRGYYGGPTRAILPRREGELNDER